ncbi:MAG: hypothetical protein JW767_10060 [Thermoleophilia bacterium]|nr:hypothetical protein [Thermoleophilia bacterium]
MCTHRCSLWRRERCGEPVELAGTAVQARERIARSLEAYAAVYGIAQG